MSKATVLLSLGLIASVGWAATATPQQVFRAGQETVRVFTTVTDRDGRLVTTLTRQDFEVREDGKPQPLTVFDNAPQPIRLVVMLDVSGSMEGNLQLLRASSEQLFNRLRPDDLACIGTFGKDVTISESFTHDTNMMLASLPTYIAPDAPTPLWRAVDEAIDTLKSEKEQRRVILVLTDGKDTGWADMRHRPSSQADVIDHARDQDVMIYAVGMRSRPAAGSRPPMGMGTGGLREAMMEDLPDPGLARVAEETGGGYTEIRYGQDLGAAFARVADELHGQYLLGYAPPKHDGKVHKVDVRVSQRGLKARAKKTYVAPKG